MSRRPNITPTVEFSITVPEDLHAKMILELFSAAEGKVPYGASRAFFTQLLRHHFEGEELDLAPYAGVEPGAFTVRGSPTAISILKKTINGELSS